jgi:ribonuclease HIII
MPSLDRYIARIEESCGEEKDFVVILKYDKREEAMKKILEKGKLVKSYSEILFDIAYKDTTFRAYKTGKMIFKKMKSKEEVETILKELLL